MAEALQQLLDRIQKEGVEKADHQADQLVAAARERAAQIKADAERAAKAMIENAARESALYTERANRSLQQAARDLLLSVGDAIGRTLDRVLRQRIEGALAGDTLNQLLQTAVRHYCTTTERGAAVTVLANPAQVSALQDYALGALAEELRGGRLTIQADNSVVAGFKVYLSGAKVEHDFTAAAIARALSELVRPHLAEIVRAATQPPA